VKRKPRAAPYIRRARQRFLAGTWHRTPADAVNAGFSTLERWTEILNEERERERLSARGLAPEQVNPRTASSVNDED
jgi:hypothetical protein